MQDITIHRETVVKKTEETTVIITVEQLRDMLFAKVGAPKGSYFELPGGYEGIDFDLDDTITIRWSNTEEWVPHEAYEKQEGFKEAFYQLMHSRFRRA